MLYWLSIFLVIIVASANGTPEDAVVYQSQDTFQPPKEDKMRGSSTCPVDAYFLCRIAVINPICCLQFQPFKNLEMPRSRAPEVIYIPRHVPVPVPVPVEVEVPVRFMDRKPDAGSFGQTLQGRICERSPGRRCELVKTRLEKARKRRNLITAAKSQRKERISRLRKHLVRTSPVILHTQSQPAQNQLKMKHRLKQRSNQPKWNSRLGSNNYNLNRQHIKLPDPKPMLPSQQSQLEGAIQYMPLFDDQLMDLRNPYSSSPYEGYNPLDTRRSSVYGTGREIRTNPYQPFKDFDIKTTRGDVFNSQYHSQQRFQQYFNPQDTVSEFSKSFLHAVAPIFGAIGVVNPENDGLAVKFNSEEEAMDYDDDDDDEENDDDDDEGHLGSFKPFKKIHPAAIEDIRERVEKYKDDISNTVIQNETPPPLPFDKITRDP